MVLQNQLGSASLSATATIPELQQSKTAVLNTLASRHSRRSYEYAIDRFIAWYCSEPRLEFNRSVVVRYRSFLERLSLSAATINLHLSAIRRLADESAESGWLSPEVAIGIRRVKGVKRLGLRGVPATYRPANHLATPIHGPAYWGPVFLADLYGSLPMLSPAYPVLKASDRGRRKLPFGEVIPKQAA